MKKSVVIYLHILFWIALLATRFTSYFLTKYLSPDEYGSVFLYMSFLPPIFFYVGYLLVTKVRWNVKNLSISILAILSTYVILFVISKKAFAYAISPVSSAFLWTIIGCLFRIFIDWFKKKNKLAILEKETIASNLALLKSQINPHFLFNTLHNIDTLIHENQTKASQSLVKLSDIMRYMYKDAKLDWVDLEKEIEHLESYLSLEKLRLKNEKFLSYSISGDCKGVKVAPMLLIPFVENAFKHSVDSTMENGIIIKIRVVNGKLYFFCENHFDASETDKDKDHGIGLETVKKRLNLIYRNRHELSINSDNSIFKVSLKIYLNDN